jgi:hypothetical protein
MVNGPALAGLSYVLHVWGTGRVKIFYRQAYYTNISFYNTKQLSGGFLLQVEK